MNSEIIPLSELFSEYNKKYDVSEICHYLNKKYKIAMHTVIMNHFIDAGMKIMETGKPLVLKNIFGTNDTGSAYNMFYKFAEQGYFTKLSRGFILTNRGKLLMMEFISLYKNSLRKHKKLSNV